MSNNNYVTVGTGLTGTVKFFQVEKGYGFIVPDDGDEDVFFHASHFGDPTFKPVKGERVTYNLVTDRKRRRDYADEVWPQ